jgi:hypothetical protein
MNLISEAHSYLAEICGGSRLLAQGDIDFQMAMAPTFPISMNHENILNLIVEFVTPSSKLLSKRS